MTRLTQKSDILIFAETRRDFPNMTPRERVEIADRRIMHKHRLLEAERAEADARTARRNADHAEALAAAARAAARKPPSILAAITTTTRRKPK